MGFGCSVATAIVESEFSNSSSPTADSVESEFSNSSSPTADRLYFPRKKILVIILVDFLEELFTQQSTFPKNLSYHNFLLRISSELLFLKNFYEIFPTAGRS